MLEKTREFLDSKRGKIASKAFVVGLVMGGSGYKAAADNPQPGFDMYECVVTYGATPRAIPSCEAIKNAEQYGWLGDVAVDFGRNALFLGGVYLVTVGLEKTRQMNLNEVEQPA